MTFDDKGEGCVGGSKHGEILMTLYMDLPSVAQALKQKQKYMHLAVHCDVE